MVRRDPKELVVLQWNCKSINAPGRYTECDNLIKAIKPHIVLLSETWLHPDKNISKFKNYNTTYRKDRPAREGGGLLMLVRDDLRHKSLQVNPIVNSMIEAQAIEIYLAHDKVNILHVYNPEQTLDLEHLDPLVDRLGRKFLIAGDFNGRHTLWDPRTNHTNNCGNNLSQYIISHPNIALATPPGLITYTSPSSGKTSTLDLSMCSNNLIQTCQVTQLPCHGSDHYPICTKIALAPDLISKKKRPQWKITDDSWVEWKLNLTAQEEVYDDINILEQEFSHSLINASINTFKKTKEKVTPKFNKPWWTPECAKVVAQRRRAKKRYERNPSTPNKIELRRYEAKAKRTIKQTKRMVWRKFCETLNANTPITKVWGIVKKLNGVHKNNTIPLEEHGIPVQNSLDKANILADKLAETFSANPEPLNDNQESFLQDCKIQNILNDYNKRFTKEELIASLEETPPNKTMGDDDIHAKFLKNLPVHKQTELLSLINKSWRQSKIPQKWKHSLIIPIAKPNKDPSDPSSYRPISLLSCVGKVMERMVNRRLTWILENAKAFSNTQCGFRKGRCTEDLLVSLEHEVRASLVNRKVTIGVFFDLKQAFDNASHKHILYKLAKSGIKGNLLNWIEEYLKDRTFQVLIENSKSETKNITRGVPQGSIISPTIFNILMSDIPHFDEVKIYEYADDVSIIITADSIAEAKRLIQIAIDRLEQWAIKWKLTFNPEKTKAMIFTKKRIPKLEDIAQLRIHNQEINWVKTFKYLGLTLDAPTLTWKVHIEDLCREGLQRLNVLRAIAGSSWGASREILLRLYTQYIRSKLTYGISALSSASKTRMQSLERIQNAALRISLGARKTSPIKALQVEANIPPLIEYVKELSCRYYFRIKEQEDTHPMMHSLINDPKINNRIWTHGIFKKPLVKRAEEIFRWWALDATINIKSLKFFTQPPWNPSNLNLQTELIQPIQKGMCLEEIKNLTLETIQIRYSTHLHIYTDGSKTKESTSAGMFIPSIPHEENWKINHGPLRSIMMAELYAIMKSMMWLAMHSPLLEEKDAVILTDSKSGIEVLRNLTPGSQSSLTNTIRNLAITLFENDITITLQWVPSHVGVDGNEQADRIAKEANSNLIPIPYPLERKEIKRMVNNAMRNTWQRNYDSIKHDLHIGIIKPNIESWTWSFYEKRNLETIITRLRIGHVELNAYLHNFNMLDNPNCLHCNTPETPKHYLMSCTKFTNERAIFKQRLINEEVPTFDVKTVMGGGAFPSEKQKVIIKTLAKFINETKRFSSG